MIIEGPDAVLNSNEENKPNITDKRPPITENKTIFWGLSEMFRDIAAGMISIPVISNNPTILMAAVIAISIKMVGLLLITGMLIIPAAMARNISDSPQKMVLFSVIGGLLSVILGLFSSLEFNTSSVPSIIMAALVLFILSLLNIKQSIKLKN